MKRIFRFLGAVLPRWRRVNNLIFPDDSEVEILNELWLSLRAGWRAGLEQHRPHRPAGAAQGGAPPQDRSRSKYSPIA